MKQTTIPRSWTQLIEEAGDLPHLALGRLEKTTKPLRGHTYETNWINRSWLALQTLESYAAVKEAMGAARIPHLSAYLRWPDAEPVFPAAWYSSSECNLMSARMREARAFPVPRSINSTGRVVMTQHIRVASGGNAPAPRMHFFDDTSGTTGKIHIGYIGKHLLNFRTN